MNKQDLIKGLNWISGAYSNGGEYSSGVRTGLAIAINETKKLDEPTKVVIPKFVADFIEWKRTENLDNWKMASAFISYVKYQKGGGYEWSQQPGNMDIFLSALINGYEVEKEKLYYVLDKNNHTMLYRSFDHSITQAKSKYAVDPTRKNFNLNQYELTEKEIRNYDARFMAFAVEVAE